MDEVDASGEKPIDFDGQLDAARHGSTEELGTLLEGFRGYLLRVANEELDSKLRPRGGASDLVQETMTKAFRNFEGFRGRTRDQWRAWLRSILLHEMANFVRSHQDAAMRSVNREICLDVSNDAGKMPQPLVDELASPSKQLIDAEDRARAERALSRLPPDYRRVIELYHKEHKSFDEIAEVMGRSVAAVQKLWLRALKRWDAELQK